MGEKKFLEQVYLKIKKRENLNIELRDTCIEIDAGKSVVFKIDAKGGMFYSADHRLREIVDKLYDEIQPIVCSVDEQGDIQERSNMEIDKGKEVVNTVPTKFCPNCGKPVNLQQDYCMNCGKALVMQNNNSGESEIEIDTRTILEIYKDYWKKYADFKGCTTRREYLMSCQHLQSLRRLGRLFNKIRR